MSFEQSSRKMAVRLVDGLYTEAMVLADEARGYFDESGRADRELLSPIDRVAFSCESLKVTTRLMHVIAWLLTRKAIAAGEIRAQDGHSDSHRLGKAADTDIERLGALPNGARELISASIDLYDRVTRIDRDMVEVDAESPARGLIRRLERAL